MSVQSVAEAAIKASDLRVDLSGSGVDIVDGISLKVDAGEVVGLVGESGCGKTTVGMAMLGHLRRGARFGHGEILLAGTDVTRIERADLVGLRGAEISYVPQDPPTSLNPVLRVGRQIEEVLEQHRPDLSRAESLARIEEVLTDVALPTTTEFRRRYPHQLSGGQQQRVVLAMAFVCRPKVTVCDEPTTGLDVTTQRKVLETLRDLVDRYRVAVIYVSHDLAVVQTISDRIAVMYAGRIVEQGRAETIFAAPLHPYTRRLLKAAPDMDSESAPIGIPGHAPLPGNRGAGCFFHARCTVKIATCESVEPELVDTGSGHLVSCHRWQEELDILPGIAAGSLGAGGEVILEGRDITASYRGVKVIEDVSIEARQAECLAVVGESGSGKTTLARCLAGLHGEYSGEVRLEGQRLAGIARRRSSEQRRLVQYVFQNPYGSLNPRHSIGASVAAPLRLFTDMKRREIEAKVASSLEDVALSRKVVNRYPRQLSGGEMQRVAIARALVCDPAAIICDEVTSALDVSAQAAIIELLMSLQRERGLSLVFITHNLALVKRFAFRTMVMSAGRIVEEGETAAIFAAPKDPYTKALLSDTPVVKHPDER